MTNSNMGDSHIAYLRAVEKVQNGKIAIFTAEVNGRVLKIHGRDLGDACVGYSADGLRYEAFTCHFWCEVFDFFHQCNRLEAEASGNVDAFRQREDFAAMAKHGVDLATMNLSAAA